MLDHTAFLFSPIFEQYIFFMSLIKDVDVVHSDMSYFIKGGFGMKQKIGHLDFFPNGGANQPGKTLGYGIFTIDIATQWKSIQLKYFPIFTHPPGCDSNSIQISCNHVRSIHLFTESIRSTCPFQAIMCESYDAFKKGKCTLCNQNDNLCFRFGFHSRAHYDKALKRKLIDGTSSIATYLLTSASPPYCVTHFNIAVKISDSEESQLHRGESGHLNFTLRGREERPQTIEFNPLSQKIFKPGTTITKLTTSTEVIDSIELASVISVLFSPPKSFNILRFRIGKPKIYIEFIQIESMEYSWSQRLCPKEVETTQGKEAIFRSDLCWNCMTCKHNKYVKGMTQLYDKTWARHRGVYVSYNFYYFVTKFEENFSDFFTRKVGYRFNKCYYYSQNMLHVYEISYEISKQTLQTSGMALGPFSKTLFIVLKRLGSVDIELSTHFTAHLSNSDVYLAITSSLGFGGILSLTWSLQSITQRWSLPCNRSISFWTYLCGKIWSFSWNFEKKLKIATYDCALFTGLLQRSTHLKSKEREDFVNFSRLSTLR